MLCKNAFKNISGIGLINPGSLIFLSKQFYPHSTIINEIRNLG